MKEELILSQTAKLAKEKGFNERVQSYYHPHYGLYSEEKRCFDTYNDGSWSEGYYSAPTQSLLQRWLREVNDISIKVDDYYYNSKVRYDVNVSKLSSQEDNTKGVYDTYEQALEAGLLEALKLIKL